MFYYRVLIAYKGSNYFGWQDLGKDELKPTIQGVLGKALFEICDRQECTIAAASRTDAGVHAQGQVAKLTLPKKLSCEKLQLGLNSALPSDIRIRECVQSDFSFSVNKESKSKTYRYFFTLDRVSNPTLHDIVVQVRCSEDPSSSAELDMNRMANACSRFVGEFDFYNFSMRDKNINSTVRRVNSLKLRKAEDSLFGNQVYYFEINGSGFLRQMVRFIIGALFELGRGKIDEGLIESALLRKTDEKLSAKAKAHGLHLIEITY